MSTAAATHYFNTQNAINQAEAREAKTVACKGVVNSFDSKTATIEQSKDYAQCINHLYPAQLKSGEALMLKVVIVFCFMCAIYGASAFWKEDSKLFSIAMGFTVGLCVGVCASLIIGSIVLAAIFLFT